jgi:hypothetical protein
MSDDSVEDRGAHGPTLRIWKAREAFRQGELKLTQHGLSLDGIRAQATSLLGWSVSIGTALAAVALTGKVPGAATVIVVSTTMTAVLSIGALWITSNWRFPSFNPMTILDHELESELEVLEALAIGSQASVEKNRATLTSRSSMLRAAWFNFALMPGFGLAAFLHL